MTDEERLRQHWEELAEQLGVESPPSIPHSSEQPIAKSVSPPTRAPANAEAAQKVSREEDLNFPSQDRRAAGGPATWEESPAPVLETEKPRAAEEDLGQSIMPDVVPDETQSRRRGRKPGRGTKRSRSREQPTPTETEPQESDQPKEIVAEESTTTEESRQRRPASGRRSREREEPIPPGETEPPESGTGVAPVEPAESEEDTDDLDTLRDWNVPSWTELIDSLYRPDR